MSDVLEAAAQHLKAAGDELARIKGLAASRQAHQSIVDGLRATQSQVSEQVEGMQKAVDNARLELSKLKGEGDKLISDARAQAARIIAAAEKEAAGIVATARAKATKAIETLQA
jgi:vacuolar-type H+-ATPase subunit E/Vma4